jgi:hypothetical protein
MRDRPVVDALPTRRMDVTLWARRMVRIRWRACEAVPVTFDVDFGHQLIGVDLTGLISTMSTERLLRLIYATVAAPVGCPPPPPRV